MKSYFLLALVPLSKAFNSTHPYPMTLEEKKEIEPGRVNSVGLGAVHLSSGKIVHWQLVLPFGL
jgi:hypothetical protein